MSLTEVKVDRGEHAISKKRQVKKTTRSVSKRVK